MLVVDFQDRERDGVVHLLRRGGGGGGDSVTCIHGYQDADSPKEIILSHRTDDIKPRPTLWIHFLKFLAGVCLPSGARERASSGTCWTRANSNTATNSPSITRATSGATAVFFISCTQTAVKGHHTYEVHPPRAGVSSAFVCQPVAVSLE